MLGFPLVIPSITNVTTLPEILPHPKKCHQIKENVSIRGHPQTHHTVTSRKIAPNEVHASWRTPETTWVSLLPYPFLLQEDIPIPHATSSRRVRYSSSLGVVVRPNQLQSLKYGFNERPVGLLAGLTLTTATNQELGIVIARGFLGRGCENEVIRRTTSSQVRAPPCSLASNRGPLKILVAETRVFCSVW